MVILVHFKSNTFGYVEDSELDTLIENDAIYTFKRASGWVQIDKDSRSEASSSIDKITRKHKCK